MTHRNLSTSYNYTPNHYVFPRTMTDGRKLESSDPIVAWGTDIAAALIGIVLITFGMWAADYLADQIGQQHEQQERVSQ